MMSTPENSTDPKTNYSLKETLLGRKRDWLIIGALLVIIFLAMMLRSANWEIRSLWQDEVFTAASATGNLLFEATILPDVHHLDPPEPQTPQYFVDHATTMQSWSQFCEGLSHNVQMPLYPLLMRLWMMLFGSDITHLRIFSIICSILTIPAAFLLGRSLKNNAYGLSLALVTTLAGYQIIFAQTARLYALLVLLVTLSTWLVIRLQNHEGEKPIHWIALTVLNIAGLYTHYFYCFIVGFHGLLLLWSARQHPVFLKRTLIALGAMGLSVLPWIPVLLDQMAFQDYIGHGTLTGLWAPLKMIEKTAINLLDLIAPSDTQFKIIFAVLLVIAVVFRFWQKRLTRETTVALLWTGCIVGGLISLDLICNTHRILTNRYLLLASPALYILLIEAAQACWDLESTISQYLKQKNGHKLSRDPMKFLIICLVVFLMMNAGKVIDGEYFLHKEDYRGAGLYISEHHQPGDLVFITHSGVHASGVSYYLPEDVKVQGISRRNPDSHWSGRELLFYLDNNIKPFKKPGQNLWIVFSHARFGKLRPAIELWIKAHGFQPVPGKDFHDAQVFHYQYLQSPPW